MSSPITKLREAVRASGSPLATSLGDEPDEHDVWPADAPHRATRAGAGPRVSAHREDIEIAVAAVDEGYRLHYGHPRALRIGDADLALLAGDRLYALGLARLATIGDLTAIAELADVISLSAQAHAGDDDELAQAAWEAGVAAIAHGASPRSADAKARARAGDPGAALALRKAARTLAD